MRACVCVLALFGCGKSTDVLTGPDGPGAGRVLSDGSVIPEEGEITGTLGSKVWLSDTTYSYELEPDTVTPDRVASGAMVWRYDGQATFSVAQPSEGETKYWTVPDRIPGSRQLR